MYLKFASTKYLPCHVPHLWGVQFWKWKRAKKKKKERVMEHRVQKFVEDWKLAVKTKQNLFFFSCATTNKKKEKRLYLVLAGKLFGTLCVRLTSCFSLFLLLFFKIFKTDFLNDWFSQNGDGEFSYTQNSSTCTYHGV